MISASSDFSSKSVNHKVRKLLARAYLRANRVEEALEVYAAILVNYPEDTDVLTVLGNLYGLAGCPTAAQRLYQMVLALEPGHRVAERQFAKTVQQAVEGWPVEDPLSAPALAALAKHLIRDDSPDLACAVRCAADMLNRLADENTRGESNGHQLMPALIEMNIRQARASGLPDVADTLRSLQINLTRQVEDSWADDLLNDKGPLPQGSAD